VSSTPWFDLPNSTDCGWQNTSNVAVIGAGLAGLCAARALTIRGFNVTVYDTAANSAAGASGSPAGIIKPYITRQPSDAMRFYAHAYDTLMRWLPELDNNGGYEPIGALQLIDRAFEQTGGDSVRNSLHANNNAFENLSTQASSDVSGTQLNSASIRFKQAGWLPVWKLCESLVLDLKNRGGNFVGLHTLSSLSWQLSEKTWALSFENAKTIHSEHVVLANGASLSNQGILSAAELIPARGQISAFQRSFNLNTVVSGQHYAIPDKNSVWIGASFDRGNNNDSLQDGDDNENITHGNELLPNLSEPLHKVTNRFAGVRSTTLDRFPIVGPVPDASAALLTYHDIHHGRHLAKYPAPRFYKGLAVLGGLGSRGIAVAPFAAELLADWAAGGHTLKEQNRLVSPLRFLIKRLKRNEQRQAYTQTRHFEFKPCPQFSPALTPTAH